MLSTNQIESMRTELRNLYSDIERDLLTATSRDRHMRITQNLFAVQRVIDMLPNEVSK